MYPQTLYPKTKQVLEKIKTIPSYPDFYLAGGTALALQLGHRKSIDLDFFTDKFPKRDILLQDLKPFKPRVVQENPGTLDLMVDEVKVSFLEYKYPLMQKVVEFEGTKLASVIDIACMKLSAVSSRGSKKDFIDLYFILQKHSLNQILNVFEEKYKGVEYQKSHILKSLIYFSDANSDPDPDFIEVVDWNKVKMSLEKDVKNYLNLEENS